MATITIISFQIDYSIHIIPAVFFLTKKNHLKQTSELKILVDEVVEDHFPP